MQKQKPTTPYLRQKHKRLIEQLKKIESMMLRGSLIERYKRCGKSNCQCVKGKGHGPHYYLSVSMLGARPIMIYVPFAYKTSVEKALANYRDAQQILEKISDINRELLVRRIIL
jgi:hypothetical protein